MSAAPTLAFLDIEAVTLDSAEDVIWEIGVILRHAGPVGVLDTEWRWQLHPNLTKAHPDALAMNRYDERFEVPAGVDALAWDPVRRVGVPAAYDAVAASVHELLSGAVIVGSSPWFDTQRVELFGRVFGLAPTWSHRLVDIKAYAAGYLTGILEERPLLAGQATRIRQAARTLPFDPEQLWAACGAEPATQEERHTALGDARACLRLWDAITATTTEGSTP